MIRKGHILFWLLMPAVCRTAFTQDKRTTFDKPVESIINLDSAGYVFMLGDQTLVYSEPNGEVRWKNTVRQEDKQFVVAAPSGRYVYVIAPSSASAASLKRPHNIEQFSSTGDRKTFTLEPRDDYGKKAQSVFCDDHYLYYLATKEGDEINTRKKSEERLIMNRFTHDKLGYRRFELALPSIGAGENTTYWSFIGQTAAEKFLVSKNITPESGLTALTIAAFDTAGTVTRTIPLTVKLPRKYIRPAYGRTYDMYEPRRSFINFSNLEFTSSTTSYAPVGSSSGGYAQGTTQAAGLISNGAFAQMYFDEQDLSFYVYGLFGPKPYYSIGSVYEGFYVFKYDIQGKLVWELVETGSDELLDEGYFKVYAMPGHRIIDLKRVAHDTLNFSVSFGQSRYFYAIVQGKVTATQKFQGTTAFNNTTDFVLTEPRRASEEFLKKRGLPGRRSYTVHRVMNTKYEMVFITHKGRTELYTFDR